MEDISDLSQEFHLYLALKTTLHFYLKLKIKFLNKIGSSENKT